MLGPLFFGLYDVLFVLLNDAGVFDIAFGFAYFVVVPGGVDGAKQDDDDNDVADHWSA